MSIHKMSSQVLEQIARHVPSKHSFPPLWEQARRRRRRVATASEAAARLHPHATPLEPLPAPHLISSPPHLDEERPTAAFR